MQKAPVMSCRNSLAPLAKATDGPTEAQIAARQEFQAAFFARMGVPQQFQALFWHLPDVHFFAKDAECRFVASSTGGLQKLNFRREEEVIGLTDVDIHPPRIAHETRADDMRVMATREPMLGRVEALFTRSQARDWYVTTKLPIFDAQGEVIGVMGFVRPYRRASGEVPGAQRLESVAAYIHAHHAEHIAMPTLAQIAHLSTRQVGRHFKEVFGISPQEFVVRTRVQAASVDLIRTDKALSEIALAHGFYDQSAFSKQFLQHTGETALRYRQRHQ